MHLWKHPSTDEPEDSIFVPQGHTALVIRDGVPEQFYPPGFHPLPLGAAKVEVRQLPMATSRLRTIAPPDARALTLPFERSSLYLDGALVGIVKPPEAPAQEPEPVIKAWEGYQPKRARRDLIVEPLRACLTEPLRSCLPASGICCGGRTAVGAPGAHP